MNDSVLWFEEIGKDDVDRVGGKGASLGEMAGAGMPVPEGFVVTAQAYRRFLQETGIEDELFDAVDVDPDDSEALNQAHTEAQELIKGAEIPDDVLEGIRESYDAVGNDTFVAVRSSATAEDLPDASFAGQQDTYLNIRGGDQLVKKIRDCWASLFTERAIYYRNEKGFSHSKVNIAVVVQKMVDAEKSGVMFTSHPSSGEEIATVEAAWGLGESVVSGGVTPDNYVVDRGTRDVVSETVSCKKMMYVKDQSTGETIETDVPEDRREQQVLCQTELLELLDYGEELEGHYESPQDVEWAIEDGDIYILQSRPITTIKEGEEMNDTNGDTKTELLLEGLGAAPGQSSGKVRIIKKLDEIDKVEEGDVMVTEQTTPDMVPAMKRAAAIVTDEGGLTSHAAIVSRELGKIAVVGTGEATQVLSDGDYITVDGDKGKITSGNEGKKETDDEQGPQAASPNGGGGHQPVTATDVKVNVSIPDAAERASETGADGVGLLRMEHMIMGLGKTPSKYVGDHGERAYIDEIVKGVQEVAESFYPNPVRLRTLDAPTDEFRNLEGGDDEPVEHNPMLGFRGIRRSLDQEDLFTLELRAVRKLQDLGYDNVELMLPLVKDADDVRDAEVLMERAGIDTDVLNWGVMIETPSSALVIEDLVEEDIDFVSFGTNDLTQYTLATDRNNENVAELYDEMHPAILKLIGDVIGACNEADVDSSICGQAGSNPRMVKFLVERGITSVSANIDAVEDVRSTVAREEKSLLLDHARRCEKEKR